nr:PREDICTED: Fanconi anemia core complex-associated protein 100 [Latimeria chalumnae]|eukprot:XP_014340014.1 PREDICTED: Fanconi anemia core complex-associated protein 100 [Latimeria chalumnae]
MDLHKQRVHYAAGFHCSPGREAWGKSQITCHDSEIYLCNGTTFVYVYSKQDKVVKTVYQFSNNVWQLEVDQLRGQLYVLCASRGVYSIPMSHQNGSVKIGSVKKEGLIPSALKIGPESCIISDSSISSFIVVDDNVIVVAKDGQRWKVKVFQSISQEGKKQEYKNLNEAEVSVRTSPGCNSLNSEANVPKFLPTLCCVYPETASAPGGNSVSRRGVALEALLFSLLFGVDAAMLSSPMILCGLPDGQLCCLPLKCHRLPVVQCGPSEARGRGSLVTVLHQLDQPIVCIGGLRTAKQEGSESGEEPQSGSASSCDCIVVAGHRGKMVSIRTEHRQGMQLPNFTEYHLGGPILSACCHGSVTYYSTGSDLFVVKLPSTRTPSDSEGETQQDQASPSSLTPASLSICGILTLAASSVALEGTVELLALSSKGKLMICDLPRSTAGKPHYTHLTASRAGQRIKDLLSGIGRVSERVSSQKDAIQQRNEALMHLNQILNVSCAVLSNEESSQGGELRRRQPISCSVAARWSRLLLQDSWVIACVLRNGSEFVLERGLALCVNLSSDPGASASGGVGSAVSYSFPVHRLLPGKEMEVTLPLHSGMYARLSLPVTVNCALFYSLKGIVGSAPAVQPVCGNPPASRSSTILHEGEGVCLPLSEHTIDTLHCLRVMDAAASGLSSSSTVPPVAPYCVPVLDPVEIFLRSARSRLGAGCSTAGQKNVKGASGSSEKGFRGPFTASIRISAELLRRTLKVPCSGSGSIHFEIRGASAILSARGNLCAISVGDLCKEGAIPAVEIQITCSSSTAFSALHQAITRRIQGLLKQRAAQEYSLPNLRAERLRQLLNNSEALLKEVQSLRDRLCLGSELRSSDITDKLLHVYQELRNNSLIIL